MKQIRSRFRLITMLLVCAFLLTTVLCAGSVLKTAGITLSSLFSAGIPGLSASPVPSVSPDASPVEPDTTSVPLISSPPGYEMSDTDITPVPEYNTNGL